MLTYLIGDLRGDDEEKDMVVQVNCMQKVQTRNTLTGEEVKRLPQTLLLRALFHCFLSARTMHAEEEL